MEMDVDEVRAYARYLDEVAAQLGGRVRPFVVAQGCSTAGFTGLLSALKPAVTTLGTVFAKTLDLGEDRMESTADGVRACARSAARQNQANADAVADAGRK